VQLIFVLAPCLTAGFLPGQRVHLPFGMRTGPGLKNFSGVIAPSFLKTIPFFITN